MSRRSLLLAGALALVAAGTAAGIALALRGGGGDELTPAAYLARADAVCRAYGRRLDRIPPPDLSSPADVARRAGRALPILRAQAAAVRRLDPPRSLAARVTRFFERNDRSLAALASAVEAARRGDRAAMGPRLGAWIEASADAKAASRRVGFRC